MSNTPAETNSDTAELRALVDSLAKKVDELQSREAIRMVIANYCRAVDRLDYDLLVSCYHPDALDEHGFFATIGGEQIADIAIGSGSLKDGFDMTFYSNGTSQIHVDGDKATAETYCTSTKILKELDEDGERQLRQSGVRFLDRFERRNGEWRISYRKLMGEWGFYHPLPTKTYGAFKVPHDPATMPPLGLRDRSDPSYAL